MQTPSIIAVGIIASAAAAPTLAAIDVEPPLYGPIIQIKQSSHIRLYAVSEHNTAEISVNDQQGEFYKSNSRESDTIVANAQSHAELFWRIQENSEAAWDFYVGSDLDVSAQHTHFYGVLDGTMGTAHVGHNTEFTLDRPTEYALSGYANYVALDKLVYDEEYGFYNERIDALINEPAEISGVLAPGKYQMTFSSSTSTGRTYYPQISYSNSQYHAVNDVRHFAALRLSRADIVGGVEPVPEINAQGGALGLGLLAAIWALFYERRRNSVTFGPRLCG